MSTKIFLGPNYLLDKESLRDFIICDECGAHYSVEKIQRFLKLYFFLLPTVEVPSKEQQLFKTDPNSTFEALQRLPDHLKFESPSSQGKEPTTDGEGDYPTNMDAVSFSQVMEANVNKEGKPINSTLLDMKQAILEAIEVGRHNFLSLGNLSLGFSFGAALSFFIIAIFFPDYFEKSWDVIWTEGWLLNWCKSRF